MGLRVLGSPGIFRRFYFLLRALGPAALGPGPRHRVSIEDAWKDSDTRVCVSGCLSGRLGVRCALDSSGESPGGQWTVHGSVSTLCF